MTRHFIDIKDIDKEELHHILNHAVTLKATRRTHDKLLAGRSLAMIFEKNSTRTRVSFEVGMTELGGHAVMLPSSDLQLGRGETIADTARVLSRYVDIIMMRSMLHDTLQELANYATVPVVNGLTDCSHPCQIMADLLTVKERLGTIKGLKIVWAGDGNNVLESWMEAAAPFNFSLHIACPEAFRPDPRSVNACIQAGADITFYTDIKEAAAQADVIITDTWISMGHENSQMRRELLTPYQVNAQVMALAKPSAIFLHCLPAHRGEEVTADVIDSDASAVWDEAENRLHAQKAVLYWCLHHIS